MVQWVALGTSGYWAGDRFLEVSAGPSIICCRSHSHRFDHQPLAKATKSVCPDIAEELLSGC